ncbi:MAG: NADH-quinone oxidoreductase subunit NuoE [Clostridiales bacterium]|nr:NADH-quinone oxidoreductase subunit NuoE [Clostridiales bacterium]
MAETVQDNLTSEVRSQLKQIVDKHSGQKESIIMILNETQEKLGYVPYEAQRYIALETGIPLAEIYGIVTFYSRFSLKPVGKYKISSCLGTACYVKNAQAVLERIEEKVGIKAGETSADGKYSFVATRCIGACGLAPVITINEDVYGRLTPDDIDGIIEKYK